MRKANLLILLISYILLASSCSKQHLVQIGQLKNLNVLGFEENALSCQAELEIDNRHFLPFKLDAGELNLYSSNKVLGTIEISKPLRIKALLKKTYRIDFKLKIRNTQNGLSSLIQKFFGKSINYRIVGNIHAHSFLMNKDISIDVPLLEE